MKFYVKQNLCFIDAWVVPINTITVEFTQSDTAIIVKSSDIVPAFEAIEVNIDTLEKSDGTNYIDRTDVEVYLPDFFFKRSEFNFAENLTENGDGTGNRYGNNNYSNNPTKFYYQHTTGSPRVTIKKITVTIEDDNSFDGEKYGNNITLTDGILFEKRDSSDNVVTDFTADSPILRNVDYWTLNFNTSYQDLGSGANFLIATFHFEDGLVLQNGEQIVIELRDNFSKLNANGHFFKIYGNI